MSRQALRVAESCVRQYRHISTHTRPTSFATASYCSISTSATGRRNAVVPTGGAISSPWARKGSGLRQHSSVGASLASGSRRWNSSSSSSSGASLQSTSSTEETSASKEPRLSLTFTCTAPIPVSANATGGDASTSPASSTSTSTPEVERCGHRSSHTFTKRAYEKGIVIIACPSCKNRHLIADNMGWFKNQDGSEGGKTVEDFVKANGETVQRGQLVQTPGGDVEFAP